MTDPQPTPHHITRPRSRLRAGWRLMIEALRQAVPADDPLCEHGYGTGYCPGEICRHSDQGDR